MSPESVWNRESNTALVNILSQLSQRTRAQELENLDLVINSLRPPDGFISEVSCRFKFSLERFRNSVGFVSIQMFEVSIKQCVQYNDVCFLDFLFP